MGDMGSDEDFARKLSVSDELRRAMDEQSPMR